MVVNRLRAFQLVLSVVAVAASRAAAAQPTSTVTSPPPVAPAGAPLPTKYPPPPLWMLPPHLAYEQGAPIPAGYVVERRARRWAVITGTIVSGAPYLLSLAATSETGERSAELFIPLAGPWLLLASDPKHCDPGCSGLDQTTLVVDGVLQVAGVPLIVWGIVSKTERLTRVDLVDLGGLSVALEPTGNFHGLSVVGLF